VEITAKISVKDLKQSVRKVEEYIDSASGAKGYQLIQ
jgi:hypothetical protein